MKTTKKLFALLMAVMMLFATAPVVMAETAEAETITIIASDDTYINSADASTNFSKADQLMANNNSGAFREAYIKFDLSSLVIPEGYEIDTAKITVNSKTAWGTATTINISSIDGNTAFGELTYNNAPAKGTTAGSASITAKQTGPCDVDISDYVKALSSLNGNIAFAINGNPNGSLYLSSLESNDGEAAKLTVTLVKSYVAPVDAPVTIATSEDTYVNGGDSAGTNFSTADQLLTNNGSGNYFREAYIKFDLSSLVIPEGYEIDTAKITVYSKSTYGTATTINILSIPGDTVFGEMTYNNAPTKGTAAGSASVTAKQTGPCDVDISDYIKSLNNLNGNIAFAINGNGSLYLSSLESNDNLAAKLTVTFVKASEKTEDKVSVKEIAAFALYNAGLKDNTIDAKDVIYTPYANSDGYYTLSTIEENNLTAEENRYVMMSFSLDGITVPEGKVIKSATLKTYFVSNYSEQPVTVEAIGVSNTSFAAATATWNNQPEMDGPYIGKGTVAGSASSNVVNDYTSIDITPYVSSCYYGNNKNLALALHVAGIYTKANGGNGSVTMKAYAENAATNPTIELVYAEADETLNFGEMAFYQNRYNNPVQELASGRVVVEIPVNYAGNNVKSYNVFLAAYDTETEKLLYANKETVSFAATNGQSVTAIFNTPKFNTTYTWRAFLWNDKLAPIIPDDGISGPQE